MASHGLSITKTETSIREDEKRKTSKYIIITELAATSLRFFSLIVQLSLLNQSNKSFI